MISIGNSIDFTAHFVDKVNGAAVTGLTVTCTVYRNNTAVQVEASATEIGNGLYRYTLTGGFVTQTGTYLAVFNTASATVAQQSIANVAFVSPLSAKITATESQTTSTTLQSVISNTLVTTSLGAVTFSTVLQLIYVTLYRMGAGLVYDGAGDFPDYFQAIASVTGLKPSPLEDTFTNDQTLESIRAKIDGLPTALQTTASILNAQTSNYNVDGSIGEAIAIGGTGGGGGGDVLSEYVPASYLPGQVGYIIGNIKGTNVSVRSPVTRSLDIKIRAGDDYTLSGFGALSWSSTDWATIGLQTSGRTITLQFRPRPQRDGDVLTFPGSATSSTDVIAEITSAQTSAMLQGTDVYVYALEITTAAGAKRTLATGRVSVEQEIGVDE